MDKKTVQITMDACNLTAIFELRGLINGAFYSSIAAQSTCFSEMMEHILESYDRLIAKPVHNQIIEAIQVDSE